MSKFKDIATITNAEMDREIVPVETPKTPQIKSKPKMPIPVQRGDKEFIRYEDGSEEQLREYVKTLSFSDRLRFLFIKEENKEENEGETDNNSPKVRGIKILTGALVMFVIFYTASIGLRGSEKKDTSANPTNITETAKDTQELISPSEFQSIASTVESEINIYEREEMRRIRDYLDMRGNRGATLTAIKTQRSKKENTYFYLTQNKVNFRTNMEEYQNLENKIIASISFSEQAISAFDNKNVSALLRTLVTK